MVLFYDHAVVIGVLVIGASLAVPPLHLYRFARSLARLRAGLGPMMFEGFIVMISLATVSLLYAGLVQFYAVDFVEVVQGNANLTVGGYSFTNATVKYVVPVTSPNPLARVALATSIMPMAVLLMEVLIFVVMRVERSFRF